MGAKDNTQKYGNITRIIHWVMALLFIWQSLTAVAHFLLPDTPIEDFFWPTHKPLGLILFTLAVIRMLWAFMNLSNRPKVVSVAAKLGHIALYGLMVIVPLLALLRQYGSGRAFEPFGIPLMAGHSDKVAWMIEPGNLLHSTLAWLLFAAIVGHIIMAIWHRVSPSHENVFPRIWK
ncbi:cytochrome b [Vibrio gangliei]|uniref:cytochrome b n=1 Tax=Vibrio gangliei TaxID=2077090 RepID=UPI000D02177C|nr:cytochrome b [Vibrio gangliei]